MTFPSARDLVDGLAAGRWTSAALTEEHLARIAASKLNAVNTVEAERARRDAAASDTRRAAGRTLGPLDGLPITLKDAMRVAGSRTTYGLLPYARYKPVTSSRAAAALLDGGAVLVGRTNVPTGSFDWNGKNELFPETCHPIDPARSPGGSSAGAAAAVASGLAALDVGSDLGGSIRVPCHWCGVYGLRTTDGWVPMADCAPEDLPTGYEHLVTLGPIAREAGDLALVLDAWAAAFPVQERALGDGPVAVTWSVLGLEAAPATRAAIERWLPAGAMEAAPDVDLEQAFRDWGVISGFEFSRGMPWYGRPGLSRWIYGALLVQPRLGPGRFTTCFRAGLAATAADYEAAMARRDAVHAGLDAFFARYRAWALPITPGPALLRSQSGRAIDGVPYADHIGAWNAPTALFGTPALTIPLATSGLPLGVQVHGPRFSDRALVRGFSEGR